MSKPMSVSREAMLVELDFMVKQLYEEPDIVHDAIRVLIEKVGEWQKWATLLLDTSPTLEQFVANVPLKRFVKEIRDFGEEK